ncbi:MAG: pantoate kinase [Halobacteria archaeon]
MTEAFAPGHVTGFFVARRNDDPLESGSVGAGFTIEDGVTVSVEEVGETRVFIEGEETEFEPVEKVVEMMEVDITVEMEFDVPLGSGFGASGAATLATGLAANNELSLGKEREQIVAAAHTAEIKSETGLGDVCPQAIGGVVTRLDPGAIGVGTFGEIDHTDPTVTYTVLGELDTSDVLGNEKKMERINETGEESIDRLLRYPSVAELTDVGWEFALETNLTTPAMEKMVTAARKKGAKASMAMLGETVYAVEKEDDEETLENVTGIDDEGARVL